MALLHTNTHDAKEFFRLPLLTKDGTIIVMPKRSSNLKKDLNKLAVSIVDQATGEVEKSTPADNGKNPAAVALGRLGGLKGGKARAAKLSARQRKNIAIKAAKKRWKTRKKTH